MVNSDSPSIRDTLFGDIPLSMWPDSDDYELAVDPWRLFLRARTSLEAGNTDEAIDALKEVITTSNLESRHYLQAWSFLRSLGASPKDSVAREVYGVVVEVALEEGLDIVAGYADHTARYFNYSGAAVIWETQQEPIAGLIDQLLKAGETVVKSIGPWEGARLPAPSSGRARINMLTPGGLYFGEAPLEVLSRDPIGAPVIQAATLLMQALISRAQ